MYVCGDLFDHIFDRQLPRTLIGKYKHCYNVAIGSGRNNIFISMVMKYSVCGLVSWRMASGNVA
jgi:hypothetical protein